MPKCVQCEGMFPPHFMVDIEIEEVKEDPPQKCAFCYLDRKDVTMVNDETKEEEVITKEEAKKRYEIFLKRLSQTRNIAKILKGESSNRLILT